MNVIHEFRIGTNSKGEPWTVEVPVPGDDPIFGKVFQFLLGIGNMGVPWKVVALIYEPEDPCPRLETLEPLPLGVVSGILEIVGDLQDRHDLPPDFDPEMN